MTYTLWFYGHDEFAAVQLVWLTRTASRRGTMASTNVFVQINLISADRLRGTNGAP